MGTGAAALRVGAGGAERGIGIGSHELRSISFQNVGFSLLPS